MFKFGDQLFFLSLKRKNKMIIITIVAITIKIPKAIPALKIPAITTHEFMTNVIRNKAAEKQVNFLTSELCS